MSHDRVNILTSHEQEDIILLMMREQSGLWDITEERVARISEHVDALSLKNRIVINEMISTARSDDTVWVCKAEYYAALAEIQHISQIPTIDEVSSVLDLVIKSSETDKVSHREWVKETVRVLHRVMQGMK